jgi:hypothetical protein
MAEAMLVLAKLVGALQVSSSNVGQVRPIGRVTTQPDRPAHFTLALRQGAPVMQALDKRHG